MRGRRPFGYTLKAADRRQLEPVARDGHVLQRVARRAQALLALGGGNEAWTSWTGAAWSGRACGICGTAINSGE
jgi:hypothetical protein